MNIIKEKIIFKQKGLYPAFPSIIKISSGYIVSFRVSTAEKEYSHIHSRSRVCVMTLDKNYNTKKVMYIAENDIAAKQDTGLFRMPDGNIVLYYFRYSFHPICEMDLFEKMNATYIVSERKNTIALLEGVGLCVSKDNGKSFGEPCYIDIDGVKHFAIRGSMCFAKDKIYTANYAYKKKKDVYQCYVIGTKDFIKWNILSLLCETVKKKNSKIEYFEPSLIYIEKSKTMAAFIRTHESAGENIYGYTSLSYSNDYGKTFSKPKKTNIEGYPLHPLMLQNGKLALIYGYRKNNYGVRMRLIDNLEDIDNAKEFVIEDEMYSSDTGYPWAVEKENGVIICTYYGHGKDGARYIKLKEINIG